MSGFVAVVGGHGKVALLLAEALTARGHRVRSTVRRPEHRGDVEAAGAEAIPFDLERQDAAELAEAIAGADAVVFAAGGGADGDAERKRTVDLGGSLMAQQAAERAGVRRFVQVSAIGVDADLPEDTDRVWRAYVEAKRDADAALRASDLDWTIVRPGQLTDGPATGRVAIAAHLDRGDVSRADVAAVIAAVLEDDGSIGAQFELTAGESSIADALSGRR